jgi:integrase
MLHNAGVSQEIRQRIMGHTSPEMNDRYTHTDQATLQAALSTVPMVSIPKPQ